MENVHALTTSHDNIANSITSPVEIVNLFTKEKIFTRGLWDTGATHSAITKSLAEKLGLIEIQKISVSGVHGINDVSAYYVDILLSDGKVSLASLVSECTELSSDGSVGALIGMNVINKGDFAITNFQDKTTMSFRVPSLQKIDFVTDNENETVDCKI
jgi:predicted aspartyl protease